LLSFSSIYTSQLLYKGFLYLLNIFGYKKEFEQFINIAINSNKWIKWMLNNSKATEIDKAIICGHYIFSNPEILTIKEKIKYELLSKDIHLDDYLKNLIKQSMMRYIQSFKMI